MSTEQIQKINSERLAGWSKKFSAAHATPVALIGVGHDHKAGEIHLCICENGPTNQEIAAFLRGAAAQLDARAVAQN